jgi:hypothetical protein
VLSSAPWSLKEKYQHTTINMDITFEDDGGTAVALEDSDGTAVALEDGVEAAVEDCSSGIGQQLRQKNMQQWYWHQHRQS